MIGEIWDGDEEVWEVELGVAECKNMRACGIQRLTMAGVSLFECNGPPAQLQALLEWTQGQDLVFQGADPDPVSAFCF